jgi:hypothetical protein
MVEFLYRAKYNVDSEMHKDASGTARSKRTIAQSVQEAEHPLMTHAYMYVLGDKYDIPALKELACRNYKERTETQWNAEAFSESAELVYNNIVAGKDPLKNAIYEAARARIECLINEPSFDGPLRRINNFAADILVSFVKTKPGTPRPLNLRSIQSSTPHYRSRPSALCGYCGGYVNQCDCPDY